MTEAGNRTVHEPRIFRRQRRVVEPEFWQRTGSEILDEHVRFREQAVKKFLPGCVFEIERDAFFVAIDAEEVCAFAFDKRRSPGAGVVALAGLFDLDDPR